MHNAAQGVRGVERSCVNFMALFSPARQWQRQARGCVVGGARGRCFGGGQTGCGGC